jgi:integrase
MIGCEAMLDLVFLTAAGTPLHDLVVAALETCCRKGELLSLQWKQVEWDRNRILLPAGKTKSKKERGIPMSGRLRALLESRRFGAKPEHYVFGNEEGDQIKTVKTAWKLANRRAGIRGLHFHDLRREGASAPRI